MIRALQSLHAVNQFSLALLGAEDVESILETALKESCRLLGADRGFLFTLDGSTLHGRSSVGVTRELDSKVQQVIVPLDEGLIGEVARTNEAKVVTVPESTDLESSETHFLGKDGCAIFLPLRGREQTFGVLILGLKSEDAPDYAEVRILDGLGRLVGLAAEKAWLLDVVVRSRGRYRQIVDTANALIFALDLSGKFTHFNHTAEEQTGWAREELIGQPLEVLIDEAQREKVQDLWWEIQEGSAPDQFEFPICTRAGEEHLINWSTADDFDARGNQVGVVFVGQDITRQRKMEQSLQQSEKLAALGTMISGVAHELNNPLTAVIGYSEMLTADPCVEKKVRDELKLIHQQAVRCREVVTNLLRFARKEKGIRLGIDLNQLLEDCLRLKEYDLRLENISVELSLEDSLPSILGDPQQLRSAFLNFLNNAQDAMMEKGGEGTLSVRTRQIADRKVEVVIEDTGGGVKHPDRIFEPFYTTKPVGKGTGLGLSVCYGIVTEHGGIIQVTNTGPGARFSIEFTLPEDVVGAAATHLQEKPLEENAEAAGKSILVIDDDRSIARMICRILEARGYTVTVKNSADHALEALQANDFHAVLSDIRMPGRIDGAGLFRWLSRHRPELSQRMAFISGDLISEKVRSFVTECSQPILAKPFEISELVELVDSLASP